MKSNHECPICFVELPPEEFINTYGVCDHRFCKQCGSLLCDVNINSGAHMILQQTFILQEHQC